MAYFYFDFRNANKQSLRDLLPSLLTQLSARSSPRCNILSKLYSVHDNGKNQPSDSDLTKCLEDMFSLPDQRPIYLIMDAIDESPMTSGIPSARERVLQLLKELVDLGLSNLHICVTSRPEIEIRNAIEPLTSLRVSLHDQIGQKGDIADYVRSIVYSNSDTNMKRWKNEDKEIVVKTLAERADGMFVNHFMFVILFQIVKQVQVDILSVGSPKGLSSIERPAFSRGITRITGRDLRACAEGDQEAESRSRSTSTAMPCRGHPATPRRGACRSPRDQLQ
jgi:hypothetical protein